METQIRNAYGLLMRKLRAPPTIDQDLRAIASHLEASVEVLLAISLRLAKIDEQEQRMEVAKLILAFQDDADTLFGHADRLRERGLGRGRRSTDVA
jgi:sugar/nucleoside kinase (ribokinase family)